MLVVPALFAPASKSVMSRKVARTILSESALAVLEPMASTPITSSPLELAVSDPVCVALKERSPPARSALFLAVAMACELSLAFAFVALMPMSAPAEPLALAEAPCDKALASTAIEPALMSDPLPISSVTLGASVALASDTPTARPPATA